MSVLIAGASRYGTTKRIAERVAAEVPDGKALDISKASDVNPSGYDIVLVGGPIYAGRLLRRVSTFCEAHRDALSSRPVGLFVSCLDTGEKAMQQLESGFPAWLLARAFGKYTVGGAVRLDGMSFLHRLIMKGVLKGETELLSLDEPEINRMIAEIRARVTG